MSHAAISNYDMMRNAMELEFIKYNQEEMIDKFQLSYDREYLYIYFVGKEYRINRFLGKVEYYSEPDGAYIHANYNESMTIFDVLCYSKSDCQLAGTYIAINNLKNLVQITKPGSNLFAKEIQCFTNQCAQLECACKKLGGKPQQVGDVAYIIPLFEFLPIMIQFWDADDEFEAVLKIMWDENILDYMHYETTFFATSHLLTRLTRLMELCRER